MKNRFINQKQVGALLTCLLLTACGETTEERDLRQTQFNGKPLEQVIAVIGSPRSRSEAEVIWSYSNEKNQRVPIEFYQNGKFVTVGHRIESLRTFCTYTAQLQSGVVSNSHYDGNNCYPFAPQLPSID